MSHTQSEVSLPNATLFPPSPFCHCHCWWSRLLFFMILKILERKNYQENNSNELFTTSKYYSIIYIARWFQVIPFELNGVCAVFFYFHEKNITFYFPFFRMIFLVSGYKGYRLKGFNNPTWPPICVYFNSLLCSYDLVLLTLFCDMISSHIRFSSFVVFFLLLLGNRFIFNEGK